MLDASCGRLIDGRIGVALNLALTTVQQPIPEFTTTLVDDHKVTIQLPESMLRHWRSNITLPNGGVALCSWAVGEEHVVLLLRARTAP
jgi:hypothetical protein